MNSIITSPVLNDFTHAFTTRLGGVSNPPYDSFNFAIKWGDEKSAVCSNYSILADLLHTKAPIYTSQQVHGNSIYQIRVDDTLESVQNIQADALICYHPDALVGVCTADCVPILIGVSGFAVAAVHAGWRGTLNKITMRTIERLLLDGCRPLDIRVAMGPSICLNCLEIGEEVASLFEVDFKNCVRRDVGIAKPHLDLKQCLMMQLQALSIQPEQVDINLACTCCQKERFFSYRRSGSQTGQHLSCIGWH